MPESDSGAGGAMCDVLARVEAWHAQVVRRLTYWTCLRRSISVLDTYHSYKKMPTCPRHRGCGSQPFSASRRRMAPRIETMSRPTLSSMSMSIVDPIIPLVCEAH